ncbi:hypothetical protein AVEN_25608-1 [Araneus ventricosus]|uniref:Uncharacterized protein n=1 Tax=Araneus ventricosus TaxID=182803 RepID=A0A4Y2BPH2_ARAVE|nr:hypothetical protein AVEN_25608-1 [Araneus ventricosus]
MKLGYSTNQIKPRIALRPPEKSSEGYDKHPDSPGSFRDTTSSRATLVLPWRPDYLKNDRCNSSDTEVVVLMSITACPLPKEVCIVVGERPKDKNFFLSGLKSWGGPGREKTATARGEKVHYVEADLSFSVAFSVSMEMREQQERLKSSQTKHLNSSRLPPSRDFPGYRMGCRVAPHQLSPGWNMVANLRQGISSPSKGHPSGFWR